MTALAAKRGAFGASAARLRRPSITMSSGHSAAGREPSAVTIVGPSADDAGLSNSRRKDNALEGAGYGSRWVTSFTGS
jgi:hypothetical protein